LFEQEDGQLEGGRALKSESQGPSEEGVSEASDGSESEHDEIVEVIETWDNKITSSLQVDVNLKITISADVSETARDIHVSAFLNRGPAYWLQEQTSFDFLVIETAQLEVDYRRKGIGSRLVYSILEQARKRGVEFAFVWPTGLGHDPCHQYIPGDLDEDDVCNISKATAIDFWRVD
jgi:GNAT superfamily N-acetyltransferase